MRAAVLGATLLLAMGITLSAQTGQTAADDTARILSLEKAWNGAELKHDTTALNLLLADTFQYTDSDGSYMNKEQWLARVKSGVEQYDGALTNTGMFVQIYGTVAVVTGEYQEKLKLAGKSVRDSGRFTDVWIQQGGEWKCVASQATLIRH